MKCNDGKDIVALAATLAVKIADRLTDDEICALSEFLSLFKCNLDTIKCNRKKCR